MQASTIGAKPGAAALAVVFLLYFLGAKLGVVLTVMPEGIATLWPPNAVLLAALVRFEGRGYPLLAAIALAAELAADWPRFTLTESLLFGLVNLAEATLAYALLRSWRFDARFATPADLGKFAAAGPGLSAFAAALAGAAIYSTFRGSETAYLAFVQIWWFGDAMGLLIVTPLLLGFPPFGRRGGRPLVLKPWDAAVWTLAAIVLTLFWQFPEHPFLRPAFGPVLLLPFVLYAAAAYPQRWAAVAVALAALAIAATTKLGMQPFGVLRPALAVAQAQQFLFIMSVMALGLASMLAQLRAQNRALEQANRAARELTAELEVRVEQRTAELRRANEQLTVLASVDPLTDLYNRRGLLELAEHQFALARRTGRDLAVLLVDLDNFKALNDRYGHEAGDEALRHCASVIESSTRASDICGRYGGEEFLVVAPEIDLAGAEGLAERVRQAIRAAPAAAGEDALTITASVGVSVLGAQDTAFQQLVRRADQALYRAKRAGRDRVAALAPE